MDERLDAYIASYRNQSLSPQRSPRGTDRLSPQKPQLSASYKTQQRVSGAHGVKSARAFSVDTHAAPSLVTTAKGSLDLRQNIRVSRQRARSSSTSDLRNRTDVTRAPQTYSGSHHSSNVAQDRDSSVPSSGHDYASERARYNKARLVRNGSGSQQERSTHTRPQAPVSSSNHPPNHSATSLHSSTAYQQASQLGHKSYVGAKANQVTAVSRQYDPDHSRPRMSSVVDAFLGQILHSVSSRDGQRLTSFIVLDFDSLPAERRQPYGDLHIEVNQRYPTTKDAALSAKVKQALPADQLSSCHSAFTESIIQYFRYVRDYVNDSALLKARKIEKLTRSVTGLVLQYTFY